MSHIDKALRAWEGASGRRQPTPEVEPSGDRAALGKYRREQSFPIAAVEAVPRRDFQTVPRPPARSRTGDAPSADEDLQARLVSGGLDAMGVEQYRRLATSLHEAKIDGHFNTVMLTSALPHEGKTLTTVNLALTLSGSFGRRVLIIDADLRRPSLHEVFSVANERGLSEALGEHVPAPTFLDVAERLSLLPAGRPGSMPLAGLSSPRMGDLLKACSAQFDWVLIDTPPVGLLPDAHLLARVAGAVILVVGVGMTPAATIQRVVDELGSECIIGTVLNRVDTHHIDQAAHYGRYYDTESPE